MNQWPQDPPPQDPTPAEPAFPEQSQPATPENLALPLPPEDHPVPPTAETPTFPPQEAITAPVPQPASPEVPPPAAPPQYPDRSTGLTVFGIVQILLGLLCLLGIPFILLSAVMARKTMGGTMPAGSYVLSVVTYALLAGTLITLGIGSIRARRWAWAITLITSWIWLIVGFVMTIMLAVVMPSGFMAGMRAGGGNAGQMSRGVIAVILTFVIVFLAAFLVALPVGFLIFYRRKDVRETCRRRDPNESWTERVPLPVLAATLLFGYGVVYYLLMSFTAPILPFFGKWITGWRGGLACLVLAGLDLFLALAFYRLKAAAWWVAVGALALRLVSSTLTIVKGNLFEAYSRMGMPQKQVEMMHANPAMRSGTVLWSSLIFTVGFLGYMIWIKRYFKPGMQAPVA